MKKKLIKTNHFIHLSHLDDLGDDLEVLLDLDGLVQGQTGDDLPHGLAKGGNAGILPVPRLGFDLEGHVEVAEDDGDRPQAEGEGQGLCGVLGDLGTVLLLEAGRPGKVKMKMKARVSN